MMSKGKTLSFRLVIDPIKFHCEPFPRAVPRKAALSLGFKRYFTGRPCQNKHLSVRTLKGECVACQKDYKKRWRLENKEKVAAYAKEWVARNPERSRAIKERWAEANFDLRQSRGLKWRAENPDRKRELAVRHYLENRPEYIARAVHRHEHVARATPLWADLDAIKEAYRKADCITKETGVPQDVDHIIPLQGEYVCGLHVGNNLRALPRSENRAKSNHFDLEDQTQLEA